MSKVRRLIESTFVTLGGEIGSPQVWGPQYLNSESREYANKLLFDADALLLGRITYEGFSKSYPTMDRDEPGTPVLEGKNLEVDPPHRLVQSFNALWGEDVKSEGTSRVTWEIEQVGDSCMLTVTHDQLREGANDQLFGGWPMILSGLKTLLETGEKLTTPGSLRFS